MMVSASSSERPSRASIWFMTLISVSISSAWLAKSESSCFLKASIAVSSMSSILDMDFDRFEPSMPWSLMRS